MYTTLLTLAALLSASLAPAASNPWDKGPSAVVQTEQLRAELVAHASEGLAPGKTVWLGLQLRHQPQWHTYWKNPGDSGLPTELEWNLPPGLTAGDIAWPMPQKIRIGSLANIGYEGQVLLPVPLTVGPDFAPGAQAQEVTLGLTARWLVCKEVCVPQEGQFVLKLPLHSATANHRAAFDAARQAIPTALSPKAVTARLEGNGVLLTVARLPAAWVGRAINAFPETPQVLDTPQLPAASDRVSSGTATQAGTQAWSSGANPVWTAYLPLAPQRSAAPKEIAWVLGLGDTPWQVSTRVQGTWPPGAGNSAANGATVSPALNAALEANAQAARNASYASNNGLALASPALWLALGGALLGGLLLNLMPCVFPVLAIKVLAFAQHPTGRRRQGLAYTAGVLMACLALGGLLLVLRAGGEQLGWGFQLQSPGVIAALVLLFTLIGLNLLDLLPVGNLLPSRWANLQLRHPLADAWLSGLLTVAIASPCSAPFMGASLGYAITLPAAQALAIFAALGLGLALPYLAASALPAAAAWLPRPGAWMQTLRHSMAFPMAATVVWLLWVLGHISGIDGVASLLLLLLGLAFVLWARQQTGRSQTPLTLLAVATLAALLATFGPNVLRTAASNATSTNTAASPGVWQDWSPQAVQTALAAGQPVLVDFTAAWCITCQLNKKTTLTHPEVLADLAAQRVVLLRADWTQRNPTITAALADLGRSGVPVNVLYRPGGRVVVFSEILSPAAVRGALKE